MSHTQQPAGTSRDDEEYYVVPAVSYEGNDYPEHNDNGFCDNMAHECHENQQSITDLNSAIVDGLITANDADRIYRGKTVI
ncbi:MAG TPA: hypothetical protein VKY19_09745 [Ktedonosporobacter sp.]|jgi:hypothetical protein|nr:hypothetical protein [Ktedonosporobacter sp.]